MVEPAKEEPRFPDVQRTLLSPQAPPKPAQNFYYVILGDNIQLDIGHLDVPAAREAIDRTTAGADGETIHVYVTDRFVLTPDSALNLLTTAQQMVTSLRAFGKLPPIEKNATD